GGRDPATGPFEPLRRSISPGGTAGSARGAVEVSGTSCFHTNGGVGESGISLMGLGWLMDDLPPKKTFFPRGRSACEERPLGRSRAAVCRAVNVSAIRT